MEHNKPSQNNNDNGYPSNINCNYNPPMMNNNSSMYYGDANSHRQQSMADSNASAQLYPSHTGHANANPPLSANYIPNPNPLQPSHNIFSFDIPGFKIIIIPVDNSNSNFANNSFQTQYQQSFNNFNNFSG
ncbi:10700_t:CDS:1 [Funneliformis mosseae]|uniref:10700_t:CDS:1 n=1 Tax=Funneliformis mosseae TaxID=27381 RepID=A0A9N9FGH1_FUNMO|nr:10700_t:CDS:1 [Funneliformis mosseae]